MVQSSSPSILALDFDGVICDGLIEYFQTAWQAYLRVWSAEPSVAPPEGLAEQFYRLRPVVETGWEMPVVLRSLLLGRSEEEILKDWPAIARQQLVDDELTAAELSASVDGIRDQWIASDVESWLAQHRFYPGVIERLRQMMESPVDSVIITTKEGRFVRQLLQQQGLAFDESRIFGKEVRQPKSQTLRDLTQQFQASGAPSIWFVEDRLKTLQVVQTQPDLQHVTLFLADWGYNTAGDRQAAALDSQIRLLSLEQFSQNFSAW